ncbi:MAG: VanZ family protein [Vicinamibacterales bacterium]|nr:VanZ family protein [Vicinamibacterales bacterium]
MKHRVWLWGPAWAMMAVIFVLSSLAHLPTAAAAVDDGVAHALEFGVLAATLLRGFAGARWHGVTVRAAWLAVVLTILYGVTDEVHQWFVPGRTAEIADLSADAIGATVAVGLIWAWSIVTVRGQP